MLGTVSKQLIRYSELTKFKNPPVSKLAFYTGLVANTICGPAIDMAAYSFAPQSLIAPFGGLDVVWNALSAPYLLQEKLTKRRAFGCLLICVGTATAGAVGSHTDKVYTVDYLEDLLFAPRIPIYFALFFIWFLVNIFCLQSRPRGSPTRGVSLGMTAGTIAGNMFCVKAAVEIIQYSIDEDTAEPWTRWLTYAMLLGAAFFAISNVRYQTRGLQEYEALFMVTVYEGSMIVSNCISGSVIMLDLEDLPAWRIGLYWMSVVVVVVGMVVVFSNEMRNISSLAAGTASIAKIQDIKKNASSQTLVAIDVTVAGIGSAGIADCATPKPNGGETMSGGSPLARLRAVTGGLSPASQRPSFCLPVSDSQSDSEDRRVEETPRNGTSGVEAALFGKNASEPCGNRSAPIIVSI